MPVLKRNQKYETFAVRDSDSEVGIKFTGVDSYSKVDSSKLRKRGDNFLKRTNTISKTVFIKL